jgi:CDP-4-dehydro-6-deoxyglucose reductase
VLRDWSQRHPRLRVRTVLGGHVHATVLQEHPELDTFAIYAAGPPGMIDAIRVSFPARGARSEQLHLDSFDYAVSP